MTSYTQNRGYPYPSSEREAGNGGRHSEALARAVAADLDVLDAGWVRQATRPSKIIGFPADSAGFSSGGTNSLDFGTITTVVAPEYFNTANSEVRIATGGDGWYFANMNLRIAPTGAVTVNARTQLWVRHLRSNAGGTLVTQTERHGDTFWPSSTVDLFNRASGMFRMIAGDRIWVYWTHANVASTVKVVAAGTYLEVTRVCGL